MTYLLDNAKVAVLKADYFLKFLDFFAIYLDKINIFVLDYWTDRTIM